VNASALREVIVGSINQLVAQLLDPLVTKETKEPTIHASPVRLPSELEFCRIHDGWIHLASHNQAHICHVESNLTSEIIFQL
jgi:hypothetical protein